VFADIQRFRVRNIGMPNIIEVFGQLELVLRQAKPGEGGSESRNLLKELSG
jgi:hypothetical protein